MEGRGGRVAGARKPSLSQPPLSGAEFRRLMDGELKEARWQKQVEEALDAFGWWHMHVPPNVVVCPNCHTKIYRGISRGFPDILAMKEPYIIWLELKTERGQVETEQQQVKTMLEACGQVVRVARPRDREHVLELIAHPETCGQVVLLQPQVRQPVLELIARLEAAA